MLEQVGQEVAKKSGEKDTKSNFLEFTDRFINHLLLK